MILCNRCLVLPSCSSLAPAQTAAACAVLQQVIIIHWKHTQSMSHSEMGLAVSDCTKISEQYYWN